MSCVWLRLWPNLHLIYVTFLRFVLEENLYNPPNKALPVWQRELTWLLYAYVHLSSRILPTQLLFFFKAFELLLHQSQSQGIIQHRVHKHQRTYLHIPPNSISQTFSNTYLIFRTGKGGEKEEADVPPATHVSFCCGLASSGFIAASQKYVCFFYWKGKCWNVTSKLKRESPLK